MNFINENYKGYGGKTIQVTEEDTSATKIKSTLRKVSLLYHPDKKSLENDNETFGPKDYYLRDEIMKIITNIMAEIKLGNDE